MERAAVDGHVHVEPVDERKLISDAISGMVASLDPHSQYFDKKSYKEFREGTSGRFVGVGIEISQEDGLVKVVSPIEGSPAYRAGLKPNDLITKIDDTVVKGLSLSDAVKRMRGEPNTKVTLTIFHKDENRSFPVTITREEIKTQSVKGKVMEPVVNWLYLFQNFHLIHHLFPRVPFYLYPKAFRSLKPVLDRERAHIHEFGNESAPPLREPGQATG